MSNVGRHAVSYSGGSAFSTNVPFKKHVAQLEIVSEEDDATADEADGQSISEATGTFCTSPTCCTKESSSDEGSKLLLQQLKSSESPVWFDKEAKRKQYATLEVQPEMSPGTEVSSTRVHKARQSSSKVAPTSSANPKAKLSTVKFAPEAETSKGTRHSELRTGADLQSAFTLPPPAEPDQCYPLASSKAVHRLRRGFTCLSSIPRLWKKSVVAQGKGDFSHCTLPSSNVDDVNEMKALLNTINQNLKLLETRSSAHPQLLSTKLAPVYFTT